MTKLKTIRTIASLVLGSVPALGWAQAAVAPVPVPTAPPELRGVRYCELLAGGRKGVHAEFDVYNTIGLGSCPQPDWEKLDPEQLKRELGVSAVKLNGPRYWTLDRFEASHLLDTTRQTFGGIPMRLAGRLELGLGDLLSLGRPYSTHTVRRDTVEVFSAGKAVYELVDSQGHVFTMQSYSIQKEPQSTATLPALGTRLHLPRGWSFRTRTLTTDLRVVAVDGHATVVQDELGNTYQKSQQ